MGQWQGQLLRRCLSIHGFHLFQSQLQSQAAKRLFVVKTQTRALMLAAKSRLQNIATSASKTPMYLQHDAVSSIHEKQQVVLGLVLRQTVEVAQVGVAEHCALNIARCAVGEYLGIRHYCRMCSHLYMH